MENEKRMAGEYEIIQTVQIGDREIVVGENPADTNGQKYMTAFCESNELFARYDEVLVSDDYPEIMKYFGERIAQQAEKTREELFTPKFQGIDVSPITAEACTPITGKDDLNGKVIVIRPEVLRREYRRATNQVKLCTGGFGASPNSRGSACFCKDVYSGKLLSTMRSREISVSIIIQNLAQLKALFEKQWESIVGNCDEFLYLGGNEQSTHEYVSKLLGKETIDTNTYGQSRGRNGSYSTNWQLSGRELLTPDEVRMLDNRYALLFIRGERPVQDDKYDILHHPNVALTTDGKAKPFLHGEDTRSVASIILDPVLLAQAVDYGTGSAEPQYELLSDEEMEDYFKNKQEENA